MRAHTPYLVVAGTLLLIACGSDPKPPPAQELRAGTAVTGGAAGSVAPPPATSPAAAVPVARTSAVDALLKHGFTRVGAPALNAAPIYTIQLKLDGARYEATADLAVTNTTDVSQSRLVFALAPNAGAEGDAKAHRPLTIERVTVDGATADPTGSASLMEVPVTLAPGASAAVRITFAGELPAIAGPQWGTGAQDVSSLFEMLAGDLHTFGAFGHRDGRFNLARFYPMLAPLGWKGGARASADDVGWFPPAHFDLTIDAPADVVIVATGVEVERSKDTARQRVRFIATGAREAAFNVSKDYVAHRLKVGDVDVTSWSTAAHAATGEQIAGFARRAIEVYERRFGRYPYATLAIVEAPLAGSAGGIAFPGLIVVNDLFYETNVHKGAKDPLIAVLAHHPALRETLEFIVAHEVAHMWWGHLVATDRDKTPFADEGLSNLSALIYFEEAHGKKAASRQRTLQLELSYQVARFLGGEDHPVASPPDAFRSIVEHGGIIYGKGGLFFDALRRQVSDQVFSKALRDVINAHPHETIAPRAAVDRVIDGAPVRDQAAALARRWLDERHGDEDIGPLRPDMMLEHLIGDAAVDGGTREVLRLLLDNDQLGEIVSALGDASDGSGIDLRRLTQLFTKALGVEDPTLKRWLDVAAGVVSGDPASWGPDAVKGLVELFGDDLGLSGDDKALIEGASAILFKLLEDDPADAPAPPPTPPSGP